MFILHLNDMRHGNLEYTLPVARADTAKELEDFMEREKVEAYRDGQWGKSYAQGGPLEWYNEPWGQCIEDIGTKDDWINAAESRFDALESQTPQVPITDSEIA